MDRIALDILLEIAKGSTGYINSEGEEVLPNIDQRIAAAKACLPYTLPKIKYENVENEQGLLALFIKENLQMLPR